MTKKHLKRLIGNNKLSVLYRLKIHQAYRLEDFHRHPCQDELYKLQMWLFLCMPCAITSIKK